MLGCREAKEEGDDAIALVAIAGDGADGAEERQLHIHAAEYTARRREKPHAM